MMATVVAEQPHPRWQAAWRWGAPGLTLAALLLLAWNCAFNPEIRFLTPGPGLWIVYPLPAWSHSYRGFQLAGAFRRAFVLPEKPAAALLSWRAMTNAEVRVNNILIPPPASSSRNWKSASQAEVGPLLRQGANEISVTVRNRLGPPALSLELTAADFRLVSDETWQVSVSGSEWRAATPAAAAPEAGPGNPLGSLETTGGALGRCWPWLCVFAALSFSGVWLLWRVGSCLGRLPFAMTLLLLLAAAWVTLFLHNFPSLPLIAGFDAQDHWAYVDYIQVHKRLPPPRLGSEMYQAPLYYALSATLLALAGENVHQPAGVMVLRFLSLAIGGANLALIFAGLRLLFPGDWKKPLAGLVLAAFLPAQLCLLHYTTNETLAALFVTASLCVGLHLLRSGQPWRGWYAVLGIALGLALLSKASAVLAAPVILGVLAARLALLRERRPGVWLDAVGAPLLICLLLGGWHYWKLWVDYGNPFIGKWDPHFGAPWWQAKGFQTPGYFLSFGASLVRPFFSGLQGFWDGLYSTLWGDGLLGSHDNLWSRPPWNYDFMAAGYVLALAPTALLLTGLVRVLARSFRTADRAWLLLLGCCWLFAFAMLDLNLKVPSYAHAKAFFALPILLPFCALGAVGFEFWADRGKATRYVLEAALGLWLLNVYASFWIRPHAVQTEVSSAIAAFRYSNKDSTDALRNVLDHHPNDSRAPVWLASLGAPKNPEQAVNQLEQALKDTPANGRIEAFLAQDLALCGRLDEALLHAKRAVELAPEDELAPQTCCRLAFRCKDYKEAVAAGREALSLDPTDPQTHYNLGLALLNSGQMPEAASHFTAIVDARPAWADAQFCLGFCLLSQPGNRGEGLDHLREAVHLNPTNSAWQAVLQNALKNN